MMMNLVYHIPILNNTMSRDYISADYSPQITNILSLVTYLNSIEIHEAHLFFMLK